MSSKALTWAFAQKFNNPTKKMVLVALADSADDSGVCWPYYSTLAEKCDMGRRTVIKYVQELEADGYLVKQIRRRDGGVFRSNVYMLNTGEEIQDDHPVFDEGGGARDALGVVHEVHRGGARDALGVVHEVHRGGARGAPGGARGALIRNHNLTNKKNKNTRVRAEDFFVDEVLEFSKGLGYSEEQTKDEIRKAVDYWESYPEKAPEVKGLAAIRGWLRFNQPKTPTEKPEKQEKRDEPRHHVEWRVRVQGYFKNGFWLSNWGAKPDEPDNDIPPAILAEFEAITPTEERKTQNG